MEHSLPKVVMQMECLWPEQGGDLRVLFLLRLSVWKKGMKLRSRIRANGMGFETLQYWSGLQRRSQRGDCEESAIVPS